MWKLIPGSEKYEASTEGHIRNKKTKKVLREFPHKDGYIRTQFDGKTQTIHRVIAKTFIPKIEGKEFVNHMDGNKQNNSANNLEWCTRSENQQHAYRIGLINHRGEKNSRCKLSEEDVTYIKYLHDTKSPLYNLKALSEKYGVAHQTISAVACRQNWKEETRPMNLYPHQEEALAKLKNGNILLGDIGSGKSLTSLVYYIRNESPKDLIIITTAKKRDSREWESDILKAGLDPDTITIDSWNNIKKYIKLTGCFFIFDEQRLVGSGAWVKSFWKIAQHNHWILLTATPGDKWEDFFPVFKANGFYKTKTEFKELHMIYDPYCSYKVKGYMHTGILLKYKKQIIVEMRYKREATRLTQNYICDYDKEKEKFILRNRWDIFKDEPIQQASSLCYTLRRLVNTHEDRIKKLNGIYSLHKKMIIFYNFDYELDILRRWCEKKDIPYSEWNGHNHQEVLDSPSWVYLVQYAAGNEGWNCITCDTIVFYSLNYSYKVTKQAEGRIDRMNSPFDTLYYFYLTSRSKIDTAIQLALYKKKKFNETAFSKIF